jgi:hypothetical protein
MALVSKDNGYFEVHSLRCGHRVQVNTEDMQWTKRTNRPAYARALKDRRASALDRPCTQCMVDANRAPIAVQVADGGLWHAGDPSTYDDGYARTLCGRWGWVDHRHDGPPVLATEDEGGQPIECLRCRDLVGMLVDA